MEGDRLGGGLLWRGKARGPDAERAGSSPLGRSGNEEGHAALSRVDVGPMLCGKALCLGTLSATPDGARPEAADQDADDEPQLGREFTRYGLSSRLPAGVGRPAHGFNEPGSIAKSRR